MKKIVVSWSKMRKKYNKPMIAPIKYTGEYTPFKGEYCVGGAFCQAVDSRFINKRFPRPTTLAKALLFGNPLLNLTYEENYEGRTADMYADSITNANDNGEFTKAWKLLKEALFWKPSVLKIKDTGVRIKP